MQYFIILSILFFSILPVNAAINGNIEKNGYGDYNQVIDSQSGNPIGGAQVALPAKGYQTTTDDNGKFNLDGKKITAPTIMSVDKDGYKPFSLTVDQQSFSKPIVIGIEKSNPHDIVIDKDMYHLGDDNFSENSANAGDFRMKAIGPFFTKTFKIKSIPADENCYLVIGSIIGLDTMMARDLGQSKVKTAYSSPAEVFFNGSKIADLKVNGDNQQVKIPRSLIKCGGDNQVTVKAGRNLFQPAYIDYDDFEFMNLYIETKNNFK